MLIITIINCKFGKCNHYGKLITSSVIKANVILHKKVALKIILMYCKQKKD